jgi:hypothetical protein
LEAAELAFAVAARLCPACQPLEGELSVRLIQAILEPSGWTPRRLSASFHWPLFSPSPRQKSGGFDEGGKEDEEERSMMMRCPNCGKQGCQKMREKIKMGKKR